MKKLQKIGLIAAGVLALSFVSVPAANASNDCALANVTAPHLSGTAVAWSASGYCTGQFHHYSYLYHYFGPLPDAIAGSRDVYANGVWASAGGTTCDNGGSTTYYTQGRTYPQIPQGTYIGGTQQNSVNVTLNHC